MIFILELNFSQLHYLKGTVLSTDSELALSLLWSTKLNIAYSLEGGKVNLAVFDWLKWVWNVALMTKLTHTFKDQRNRSVPRDRFVERVIPVYVPEI